MQVANLVQEDRAAVGQLELAAPERRRAGERALLVTEQLALDELGRDRRAVHLDERPRRERALAVDVRGEQFLAGARTPREQHAHVRSRHLRRLLDGLPKRRAPPDHLRRVADQLAEPLVLALQVGALERVLDHEQHAVAGERLLQKVERAAARGVDGVANRPVPGNHHDGRRVVALPERAQQVDAVAVRQADVEQVQVGPELPALGLECADRVADGDAVAFALENQAERRPMFGSSSTTTMWRVRVTSAAPERGLAAPPAA